MIDGNISSWCAVLNTPEQLDLIQQTNELAIMLGELEKEHKEEKKQKQQKALEKEEKKKRERKTKKKKK
eukprot:9834094-Ditylum_brightwellii.AAC.1